MRSTGKKVKKNKGTVLSLNSFLGDAPQGTINVIKKITNNDGDYSDDDGCNATAVIVQLPTAPKAQRVFDDDTIPHKPPYIARLNNLPFDANEDDVHELFGTIAVKSVSLPREDGETGRLRGFGKVELENRDDFIHMLSLPEPTIRGRRIRIELFNQTEYGGDRTGGGGSNGNRRHYNNFGDTDANRESTNWRQDSAQNTNNWSREKDAGNHEGGTWRRNSPETNESRNTWRPRSFRENDNSSWRQENKTQINNEAGSSSWRTGNRPSSGDFSAWRDNNDGGGNRHRNYGRNDNSPNRERKWQRKSSPIEIQEPKMSLNDEERPRLKLLPRQLPLPVIINTAEEKSTETNDGNLEEGLESRAESAQDIKEAAIAVQEV